MNTLMQRLVTLLLIAFSVPAFAAGETEQMGIIGQVIFFGGFILIFYFLLWRPQSKRAKQHKQLMESIAKGDEVVSSGGILGKVVKVTDDYVTIEVNANVSFALQKAAITAVLPKGTLKELKD